MVTDRHILNPDEISQRPLSNQLDDATLVWRAVLRE